MADDDDRDVYRPKHGRHPTSPGGVQQVNPFVTPSRPTQIPPSFRAEHPTPVDMPIPGQMESLRGYTRETRTTTVDIQRRVGTLEQTTSDLRAQMNGLDSKVDTLVEESRYQRKEREDRERRADERAAEDKRLKHQTLALEKQQRHERNLRVFAIIVPTVAAIGAAIAGIIAATRDPAVKYIQTPVIAPVPTQPAVPQPTTGIGHQPTTGPGSGAHL